MRNKLQTSFRCDKFPPEAFGGAVVPVHVFVDGKTVEKAKTEGEAFEGDVHLVEGHEEAGAVVTVAEGGSREGVPFLEAFVDPSMGGAVEGDP